jgi:peptidoglycan/xylan/chitin deacetylase (PgdA/CDA1 family)
MLQSQAIDKKTGGRRKRLLNNWRGTMKATTFIKRASQVASALVLSAVLAVYQLTPVAAAVQAAAPAPKISFTFDDGYASVIEEAAPAMATHGIAGTAYVISGCVGMTETPNDCEADDDKSYMTWEQINQVKNTYGWEIGAHSVSHPQLATEGLTAAELEAEINGSKQTLAANGHTATSFASPYGDYSNDTLAVIAKHFSSHRGFHDLDNNVWSYNDYVINNMQVQAGVSVNAVKSRIDEAIANNHWLVLTFHDVNDSPNSDPEEYEYSTANLAAIAAYVKTKKDANQLQVVNMSQGVVQSDVNSLPNASFDSGIAGGWSTSGGASIVANASNNGSFPSATNSVRITAGSSNGFLFSPQVNVDSTQTYMLKSFLNLGSITAGELGYYIDEYNASGVWISGQWMRAQTAATVQNVNFTYQPSSAAVKKASLQIYVTGGSGIQAFVDNAQWFNLAGTDTPPPPPPSNNLLPNSNFSSGLANGWTTDNNTAFTTDAANHGSPDSLQHSIKLTAQTGNAHLFAPLVNVLGTSQYTVSAYANVATLSSGELGFYIDEYDTAGSWVSGQYVFAKRNAGTETVSFAYSPSSASVKKAGLQVILTGNSSITGYLDEVKFLAPDGETPPPPPPAPTNLVANGTFDAGIANGWTTNDPVNIVANNGGNGSPANATNSVRLGASTQNRHLFSPRVSVSASQSYSLTSFLNLQQITSGEIGFYIDEYDTAGNWISGQWKTGVAGIGAGDVSFTYTPSSASVATASLQVIVVGNSGIVAYFDHVRWFQN